jgi:thymidylate synthase (FAD)
MVSDIAPSVEQTYTKKVLDHGQVALVNHMGGDASVIAAARVSNGALGDGAYAAASKGPVADQKLINFLMKQRHGTPFEHAVFQFYVKAPLFVIREWHRHRMASYNEISGRYVEFDHADFYIPSEFRIPAASNKQGSVLPTEEQYLEIRTNFPDYVYDDLTPATVEDWDEQLGAWFSQATSQAYAMYKNVLNWGVAKELARIIMPLNMYSEFYMTVNARSLMNFLSLRSAPDAQYEIRQYAHEMIEIFRGIMPMTHSAWMDNEWVAP